SGIMAERLTDDVGLQLFANSAATAGVLYVIILMFGPVSGAHFNPAVTLSDVALGSRPWPDVLPYVSAQMAGGAVGVVIANLMFDLDAVDVSDKVRDGGGQYLGEVVATFGLVFLIFSLLRSRRDHLAASSVAAYIGGAYWFTSSTSFANPAVTVGRTLSDTFAGIDPGSAPMFVLMQLVGAGLAVAAIRVIYPARS
ncbi:MAG: aquaporin family protein, partial [Actinomycetia bacterium]|nr:aquaporin family protein [Actinomycetes bacterium]